MMMYCWDSWPRGNEMTSWSMESCHWGPGDERGGQGSGARPDSGWHWGTGSRDHTGNRNFNLFTFIPLYFDSMQCLDLIKLN